MVTLQVVLKGRQRPGAIDIVKVFLIDMPINCTSDPHVAPNESFLFICSPGPPDCLKAEDSQHRSPHHFQRAAAHQVGPRKSTAGRDLMPNLQIAGRSIRLTDLVNLRDGFQCVIASLVPTDSLWTSGRLFLFLSCLVFLSAVNAVQMPLHSCRALQQLKM